MLNSTITGNSAYASGGSVASGRGTLTLIRMLVSGNTARAGSEIDNFVPYGTVTADNHNLFGVDSTAGVEDFSPGPTDAVPPAGVLLPDILDPTLAHNGGPTQTHALVPGSPAIDAGGPVCLEPNGDPLLIDQRGRPRLVDGNGDGTAACDIGTFEFFPIVNDFVTLDPVLETAFPRPCQAARQAPSPLRPRSPTRATRHCAFPSLPSQTPFTFLVDLFGEPLL